jgi:hypothetical protein
MSYILRCCVAQDQEKKNVTILDFRGNILLTTVDNNQGI